MTSINPDGGPLNPSPLEWKPASHPTPLRCRCWEPQVSPRGRGLREPHWPRFGVGPHRSHGWGRMEVRKRDSAIEIRYQVRS